MDSEFRESAWDRTRRDAANVYRSTAFAVVLALVELVAVSLAVLAVDPDAPAKSQVAVPILAGVVALVITFLVVLLVRAATAPYRQRNEARERVHSLELQQAKADSQHRLDREESLRQTINQVKEDHRDFRERTRRALAYGDGWRGQMWARVYVPFGEQQIALLAGRKGLEDLHGPVTRMYRLAAEARARATSMVSLGSTPSYPPGEKHADVLQELNAVLDEAEPLLDRAVEMAASN